MKNNKLKISLEKSVPKFRTRHRPTKAHKNANVYSRKKKHKNDLREE